MAAHPADQAPPRRGDARTAVVWEALRASLEDRSPVRVLDVGGGTGGFAVRVAALGHHVTVVDPSPDALAILDRRAEETGVADRVTGMQGDIATVPGLLGSGAVDVVLCHGVLEVVEDPQLLPEPPGRVLQETVQGFPDHGGASSAGAASRSRHAAHPSGLVMGPSSPARSATASAPGRVGRRRGALPWPRPA